MRACRRVVFCLLLVLAGAVPATADLVEDTSLKMVPQSVGFYSTMLRGRETFDRIAKSRAYAKIKALPAVQEALSEIQREMQEDEQLSAFLAADENRDLIELAKQLLADEMFFYGDMQFAHLWGAFNEFTNSMNIVSMRAGLAGQDPEEAMQQLMLDTLENNPELLRAPSFVVGFKLSDVAPAKRQLIRLEKLLKQLIETEAPQLQGKLTRQEINGGTYISLALDKSVVPWDEVRENMELPPETTDKIINQLQQVTVSINVGLQGDYLMLMVGESNEALASFTSVDSGAKLADHPHMQPMQEYFSKPVTGVAFVKGEFLTEISGFDKQMNQLSQMAAIGIPAIPMLDEATKKSLADDIKEMLNDLKQLQVKPGDLASVSYEVADGYEGVAYNYGPSMLDDSQTLSILDHVGGDPIAFYAARMKPNPTADAFGKKWGPRIGGHIDAIATELLQGEQAELYQEIKKRGLPLLERIAKANEELLTPGFRDRQSAVVLDAQDTAAQWHASMPPAETPVPLPELSFVFGVSDAEKVKAGFAEYFSVVQDAVTAASEIMPDRVPPIRLPTPRRKRPEMGETFSYPIPPFLGLDPAITPIAGINDSVMVVTLMPGAAKRIMEDRPLVETSFLEGIRGKQVASAWHFKMNRLVEAARPWVNYGFEVAAEEGAQNPEIVSQANTVMDVLECIRESSGYSYLENGVTITRSHSSFRDLPE